MKPFWEKPITEFTEKEWEQLCDGCGLCCLHKLQDEDSEQIYYTNVACNLFCFEKGQCGQYEDRFEHNEICLKITPETISQYHWLPSTCGYKRIYNGEKLPSWHPLLQGSNKLMKEYEHGVHSLKLIKEDKVKEWEDQIIDVYLVED